MKQSMRQVLASDGHHYLNDLLQPYRRFAEKKQKKIDAKKLAADAKGQLDTSIKNQTNGLLLPNQIADKSNVELVTVKEEPPDAPTSDPKLVANDAADIENKGPE